MTERAVLALPEGFKQVYGPTWRFGSLQLLAREHPATFWVVAKGTIIPRLIRVDLEYASAFARGHPDGWDYVVDLRAVSFVHPWNIVELRKIRRLPHLRDWVAIARPGLAATLLRNAPGAVRPDRVVSRPQDALPEG